MNAGEIAAAIVAILGAGLVLAIDSARVRELRRERDDAVLLAIAARSARQEAMAAQRAAEHDALELRRELETWGRKLVEWQIVGISRPMLADLERRAARTDQLATVAAKQRTALEQIADGHSRPAQVARDVLEQERAQERRRTWATN